jgi:phosphosulfolactate synthase
MKTDLTYLPERPGKPRATGLTMMMDKGLSIRQAEDFVETSSDYTDLVKLGFGTAVVSGNIEKKISVYHNAGIKVYLGGTLFEAYVVRDMFDDYLRCLTGLS